MAYLQAWLSPQGRVVTQDPENKATHYWAFHEVVAMGIIRDNYKLKDLNAVVDFLKENAESRCDATEFLHYKLRYVRLCRGTYRSVWVKEPGQRITAAQQSAILDWCNEEGLTWGQAFAL